MSHTENIARLANELPPITLDEMKSIRLMNRMDTKFVTTVDMLVRLLDLCKGSYYAQAINGKRVSPYRTTYWDYPERHDMFHFHQAGHLPRTKVRARTYLDSGHSFLEIKRKNNHGKTKKKRVAVSSIDAVIRNHEGEEFLHDMLGITFNDLTPALGNQFLRITLVNLEKTERLTIDFDLHFHNYETGKDASMDNIVIIELKRDGRQPSPILPLLRQLRIKPAGFSKYCIGTTVTNPELRINRFKKRLIKIGKILERGRCGA